MPKLVGPTKAAKLAKVSRATIYRATADGRLRSSVGKDKKLVFTTEDVLAYRKLREAWYASGRASSTHGNMRLTRDVG